MAWAIIYPLIIAAGVYLLVRSIQGRLPAWLFGVYLLNIFFNLLFTPLEWEFGLAVGTVVIFLVLGTLGYLLYRLYGRGWVIFSLLLPYFLWVSFATLLQVSLLILN